MAGVITGAIVLAAVLAIIGIIYLVWTNWETIWGWIKTAFTAFWDFVVGLWQGLYSIFEGPVKFLWQVVEGVFIVVVAIIAIALETIFKIWVGAWKLIFALLYTVATWIYDNVILPVARFFQGLWDGLILAVTTAWKWIFEKILRPIGTWIFNNVITPVLNFFKRLWEDVSGFVSGFVTKAKEFLNPIITWIKTNVIDKISGFFSGLWDVIKNGLSGMLGGLRTIFGGIGDIFKVPLNGIIELLNKAIRGVNRLKVPDWVPGLGGKTPGIPELPKLARGGVVRQATTAMIGEAGAEAIVPLENNTEWIDKLAAKINTAMNGGNGQPIQLTVQIGEDKVATKLIDLINEKTQMSGRNAILV